MAQFSITLSEQEILDIVRAHVARSGVTFPQDRATTIKARMNRSAAGIRELVINVELDRSRAEQLDGRRESERYEAERKFARYEGANTTPGMGRVPEPPAMSAAQLQGMMDAVEQYTEGLKADMETPAYIRPAATTEYAVWLTGHVTEQHDSYIGLTKRLVECLMEGRKDHTADLPLPYLGARRGREMIEAMLAGEKPTLCIAQDEYTAQRVRGLLLDWGFRSHIEAPSIELVHDINGW